MLVLLIFKRYFSHKTDGFVRSPGAWTLMIALSSKGLCDPHDMTRHNSYNVASQSDNVLCQTPTARCIVAPLKEAVTNYKFNDPGAFKIDCRINLFPNT